MRRSIAPLLVVGAALGQVEAASAQAAGRTGAPTMALGDALHAELNARDALMVFEELLFDDFVGAWVNHCHILIHEDNGMMQAVQCTEDARQVNYRPRREVAGHEMTGTEVDAIYPPPSLELMYRQNIQFVDPSSVGGFEFPGFEFDVPKLDKT